MTKCPGLDCKKDGLIIEGVHYPACKEHLGHGIINLIGPIKKGHLACRSCGEIPDVYLISNIGTSDDYRYWRCPKCKIYEIVKGTPMLFGEIMSETITQETKDLSRLYELEEFYFHRLFSAEYAHLSEEHHAEADGYRRKLWDVQQGIKKLGGKPKASVTPPKDVKL